MKEEKKIIGSPVPVNISCTKNILNQMMNCICKIKIKGENEEGIFSKDAYATGFFCSIPTNENKNINCLMTNYHVLNEKYFEENKVIYLLLNNDNEAKK